MKSNCKLKCLIQIVIVNLMLMVVFNLSVLAEETVENKFEKGAELLQKNNFSEALQTFDNILEQDSNNVRALNYKAKTLYYIQKHDESLEILNKILESDPDNVESLYLKSLLLFEKRELETSLEAINLILVSHPEYHPAISTKCSLLSEMNRDKEAKECIKSLKK